MNKELEEVIKLYSTKTSKEVIDYLLDKSKGTLISMLVDLVTMYINDKNSSTLREFITVTVAGYKHLKSKVGYNGYKHSVYGKPIKCEAKPVNIESTGKRKLNGGGNFTDYTFDRLSRDLQEDINMLVSGFIDGRLIYVLEFPFSCPTFIDRLKKQLKKRFPNGDIPGQFLRSATFTYKDYIECKKLKVHFLLPKKELIKYRENFVKGFFEFLYGVAPDD